MDCKESLETILNSLQEQRENYNLEFKESENKLPGDFWETYSSFSNTAGGFIILGVKEKPFRIMICTLFTGQTGKEGIFMRYTYEYKINCVELYRQGKWPETPKGIKERNFRIMIGRWARIEKYQGPEALRHKNFNKIWTPEEKLELISQVLAGKSNQEVALSAGISGGMLYQWVQKYKSKGYNGLVDMKKGRPPKEPQMKKNVQPAPLTESEREELIRLRAENEYIKAENEVIKKRIALRQEKEAARLKAKKQRSSKNSVKKDIN